MFLSLWHGFYAMPFQYILDCVRCNNMAEIGECALDSVVAPGDILPRVGPEYSCSLRKIDMVKAVDGREFNNVVGFRCSYGTTVRRVAIQ